MPRFTDEWVMNKVLFEYSNNFSCVCCVPTVNNFLPNGVNDLINSVSDLESDVAQMESIEDSLLPPEIKEAIWSDRVRVRFRMKKDITTYLNHDVSKLKQFCIDLGPERLKGIFQMTKEQVKEIMSQKYKISPSYCMVISAVMEQLANYDMTHYEMDSRCPEEELFESILHYDKSKQFILRIDKNNHIHEIYSEIDDRVLDKFITVITKWLSGPKLLRKGASLGNDDDLKRAYKKNGLRFRGDRRLVRLIIARHWADCILELYKEKNT